MVTQPLDPETPKQPGEPNSDVEPERPVEVSLQPPEEEPQPSGMMSQLSQETSAHAPETGDYISEIRQSLVTEETGRSKRGTGSLIRRITGSLRRVTGPLRKTGELLSSEKPEAAAEAPKSELFEDLAAARPDGEPPAEMTGELLTGRLDQTQEQEITDDFLSDRLDSEPPKAFPDNLHTRPLDSSLAPEFEDEEIADDFLAGRLGKSEADGAPKISLTGDWNDLRGSGIEAGELLEMEEEPVLPTPGDDAPVSLFKLGMSEEAAAPGEETDWMREIRAEARGDAPAARQDAPQTGEAGLETRPEQPSLRGATGQLRNFITGILGRKEKQSQPEDAVIPDELVNNRLGRSLGAETDQLPGAGIGEEDIFPQAESGAGLLEEPFSAAYPNTSLIDEASLLEAPVAQEKVDFLEGLEVNFTNVGEIEPSDEINGYELYPEDEALLWGDAEQPAAGQVPPEIPITPEDIWGSESNTFGYGSDLRQEIWGDAAKPDDAPFHDYFSTAEITDPQEQDTYAATFLTGTDFLPPLGDEDKASGTDNLLGQVLEETTGAEETASVQDLRSIALEDYEEGEEFDYSDYTYKIDWGDEDQVKPVEAETETEKAESEQAKLWAEEAEADAREALSTDWKSWFANRKTAHKILLIEAALVVTAMVIALPYFLFMMIRGPLTPAVQAQQPNALPANLPYPTGLTLPGGWYFPLEKSTFANGKWQPSTSEWLEGSELRRVVALPWNPQTEAVIKTFQKGDGVELYLSNNQTLKYRVASMERVEVTNTQVFSDRNPSLAIILYQDREPTRWVIICKP